MWVPHLPEDWHIYDDTGENTCIGEKSMLGHWLDRVT